MSEPETGKTRRELPIWPTSWNCILTSAANGTTILNAPTTTNAVLLSAEPGFSPPSKKTLDRVIVWLSVNRSICSLENS